MRFCNEQPVLPAVWRLDSQSSGRPTTLDRALHVEVVRVGLVPDRVQNQCLQPLQLGHRGLLTAPPPWYCDGRRYEVTRGAEIVGGMAAIAAASGFFVWACFQHRAMPVLDPSENDPRPGQRLGSLYGSLPPGPKGALVVYVGSCSSCTLRALDHESLAKLNIEKIAVLATDAQGDERARLKSVFDKVLVDNGGQIAKELNVYFAPRASLLGPGLCLTAIQGQYQSMAAFCEANGLD